MYVIQNELATHPEFESIGVSVRKHFVRMFREIKRHSIGSL